MKISMEEFSHLFMEALQAANKAEAVKQLAQINQIELHYHGVQDCSFADACSRLFISEDRFFKIIDVSVHPERAGWYFVRPSGHKPGAWEQTAQHAQHRPFYVGSPA